MGVERVINGVMLSGSATVSLLPATRQYSFAISGARNHQFANDDAAAGRINLDGRLQRIRSNIRTTTCEAAS